MKNLTVKMKSRTVEESNYKSVWLPSGKTIRMAIDSNKPITELEYPEFYDIKITDKCNGKCKGCYMDSTENTPHYENVVENLRKFFSSTPKEHLSYQIAYGGGCPVSSPEFNEIIRMTKEEFNICPNFTTNGMWSYEFSEEEIKNHIKITKKYCGGVAVSAHPHLEKYWRKAINLYLDNGIRTNFHHIISDEESIDKFLKIFEEYKDRVEYFVLLPFKAVGRGKGMEENISWDYLVKKFPKDKNDSAKIAFGANFYPYLLKRDLDVSVSLYEPEILSKFIDMKDGNVYPSSFATDKPMYNIFG